VHFFWGTFDLALSRYSGRAVTPPADADVITRFGGDAEQIEAGFWPGQDTFPSAAFYSFAYPKPDGIDHSRVRPDAARWDDDLGEFVLPYDAFRSESDPRRALLDFLESTYEAGASKLGWDRELTHGHQPRS
jgi:hypothetical protein